MGYVFFVTHSKSITKVFLASSVFSKTTHQTTHQTTHELKH